MAFDWFKVSFGMFSSGKVENLKRKLRCPHAEVYVLRLWAWTAAHASNGRYWDSACDSLATVARPSRDCPRDIVVTDTERACDWSGERGHLLSAFIECGWLDVCDDGCLSVHDWWEHQGAFITKARNDRERQRKKREEKKKSRDNPETVARQSCDSPASVPRVSQVETETENKKEGAEVAEATLPLFEKTETAKKPKPVKKPQLVNPEHQAVVASLCAAFLELKNEPYVWSGAKDGKALREMLAHSPRDKIEAYWRFGLRHEGFPTISGVAQLGQHWNTLTGVMRSNASKPQSEIFPLEPTET